MVESSLNLRGWLVEGWSLGQSRQVIHRDTVESVVATAGSQGYLRTSQQTIRLVAAGRPDALAVGPLTARLQGKCLRVSRMWLYHAASSPGHSYYSL